MRRRRADALLTQHRQKPRCKAVGFGPFECGGSGFLGLGVWASNQGFAAQQHFILRCPVRGARPNIYKCQKVTAESAHAASNNHHGYHEAAGNGRSRRDCGQDEVEGQESKHRFRGQHVWRPSGEEILHRDPSENKSRPNPHPRTQSQNQKPLTPF